MRVFTKSDRDISVLKNYGAKKRRTLENEIGTGHEGGGNLFKVLRNFSTLIGDLKVSFNKFLTFFNFITF